MRNKFLERGLQCDVTGGRHILSVSAFAVYLRTEYFCLAEAARKRIIYFEQWNATGLRGKGNTIQMQNCSWSSPAMRVLQTSDDAITLKPSFEIYLCSIIQVYQSFHSKLFHVVEELLDELPPAYVYKFRGVIPAQFGVRLCGSSYLHVRPKLENGNGT